MRYHFSNHKGLIPDIIQEALKTWRRKGVISLANDIKKELEGLSKNSKKEEVKEDE